MVFQARVGRKSRKRLAIREKLWYTFLYFRVRLDNFWNLCPTGP